MVILAFEMARNDKLISSLDFLGLVLGVFSARIAKAFAVVFFDLISLETRGVVLLVS